MNKKELDVQNYVADFYEQKRYNRWYSLMYHDWWARKMMELVEPRGKILDNGCGTGEFAKFLKDFNVIGLDISIKMVKYAKKHYKEVRVGDAQNLPFKDGSFNTVFARSLLHHLPEPKNGIKEIKRVLSNGGRVVFSDTINSFISGLPRKIIWKNSKHFSDEHKNFKRKEILELISTELKIKKIYHFGYIAYPLLGFPDVIDVYSWFPFKKVLTSFLIKLDKLISRIPYINRQSWGIIIVAEKDE